MLADAAGWSRSAPALGVPRIERPRGLSPSIERLERIQQSFVLLRAEMLAGELQAKRSSEPTRALSPAAGVQRFAVIAILIEDRDRELRIVRPRTPVHIVGADQGHLVVDHDDLRVDVDRGPLLVLEVIDADAIATGVPHQVKGAPLPQPVRRTADRSVSVRE